MKKVRINLGEPATKTITKEKIKRENKTKNEAPSMSRVDRFKAQRAKSEKNVKKTSKKNSIKTFFKRLITLLLLAGIIAGGYMLYTRWQRLQKFNKTTINNTPDAKICDNILDPKCWGQALSPKLEQENGVTGVMIIGIDTREAGGVNAGLMNTDTIMVALYDHQTKKTTIMSFPRDLYVPFYINGNGPYHSKINAIYATGEARNDVDDGFDLLEENLERMVGKKIQYRVLIKLQGVQDAVNAVGGVEIDVPKYVKAQYPNDYPGRNGKPNTQWLYYEFQPGRQKMDGEHALVWARYRYVIKGDMTQGSDFARGRRQQQVIDGIKEKILDDKEDSTLKKAEKYWDMFQTISKNVDANIGLEEVFASFTLMDEADTDPINIVIDPNFAGGSIVTGSNGGNYMFRDESFNALQNYLALIWKNPSLYDDDSRILVENHLGRYYLSTDKATKFRDEVYSGKLPVISSNLTMTTATKGEATGVIIVDFSKGKMNSTTQYLAEYFGAAKIIEDPENYGYTQSGYEEDIKVIVNPEPVK